VNEVDRWIYFDGPEPSGIRPLLDAMRDLSSRTPEEEEQEAREICARIDGLLAARELAARENDAAGDEEPPTAEAPTRPRPGDALPLADIGPTIRSPALEASTEPPPALTPPETPPLPAAPAVTAPRPPEVVVCTALALPLTLEARERLGLLPFRAARPDPARAARTVQVPVMREAGLAATVPIGDDSIERAMRVVPFLGNTVGAGVVPFPRLTVNEYASLHAELLVSPARSAELRRKYHVFHEAALAALDEHWSSIFTEQPQQRAAFESALATFTAWLRTKSA
jgi:hypothetical protein